VLSTIRALQAERHSRCDIRRPRRNPKIYEIGSRCFASLMETVAKNEQEEL